MAKGMQAVVDAVRRIIMRWTVSRTDLISSASSGATSISVGSTRRFQKGDQFLIHNDAEDMENQLYVKEIVDRHTIQIGDADGNTKALKWSWPLSSGAHVVKTHNDQFIKAVFFGEPDIITDLPAIAVSIQNRSSEFFTLRSTKERYNIEITMFVSGSTQEEGDVFLANMMDVIQTGLKKNFYPLFEDYESSEITADIVEGDQFIKVPDSSVFDIGGPKQIYIEDDYNIEVHFIEEICDSTTIKVARHMEHDFDKDYTTVIKPSRLPFNSWPSDITFGRIKKGTLLKAATITWFCEEMEDHLDAGFGDPQLR